MKKFLGNVFPSLLLTLVISTSTFQSPSYAENFSDVKGHFAENAINSLSSTNIIGGYEDSTFKPQNEISRAEYVALLNRLFKPKKSI